MADIYWLFDQGGNFDEADLWSSGTVPGKSDDALIATTGRVSYNINITQSTQLKSLTLVNDVYHSHVYGTTLTLVSSALSAGSISNDGIVLLNAGSSIIVKNSLVNSFWIQTDTNTGGQELIAAKKLVNNGRILAYNGDVLTIDAQITGTGAIFIQDDTVICRSFVSSDIVLAALNGLSAGVELADSQSYKNTVSGFSTDGQTSIDLDDIGFIGSDEATFSGNALKGILTVSDGTHIAKIRLKGDYVGVAFSASSDGHGGTLVVANAQTANSTHAFISAMASVSAPAGGFAPAAEIPLRQQPSVFGPRVTMT